MCVCVCVGGGGGGGGGVWPKRPVDVKQGSGEYVDGPSGPT